MTRLSTSIGGNEVICPITKECINVHLCVLQECKYEMGHAIPGYINCGYSGLPHDCNYSGEQ